MNDEEEDAKQRDPDRDGIGPGIELGPPSVMSMLRLGQGVGSPGFANYNFPRSVESGLGNCNMRFAADVDADPAFGPGFARIPCPPDRRGTVADYRAGDIRRKRKIGAAVMRGDAPA